MDNILIFMWGLLFTFPFLLLLFPNPKRLTTWYLLFWAFFHSFVFGFFREFFMQYIDILPTNQIIASLVAMAARIVAGYIEQRRSKN